ncbi:hypothetical protein TcasGA2_TC030974 [Tribolium castaneum]|uniref:Uncharacterized protein n=1 Tax=Tribolium castaneum TaxID=7070 RepID=A0A139W9Y6_TRICA|nr:hypothetical protein TcasGA2_TC030974 [Tribolium castaneum]
MSGFNRNMAYFVLMFLPIVLAQPAGYYGDYNINLVHNYAGLADDTVDHILSRIPAGTFDVVTRIHIHRWPASLPPSQAFLDSFVVGDLAVGVVYNPGGHIILFVWNCLPQ